ncbi:MATE family efflux transporter, partial [Photobacterium sanctipauli]
GVGCGVATAIVYWLMFGSMLVYIKLNKKLNSVGLFSHWHKPQLGAISRLFKLGLPVAASIFFEVSLFAAIALLISPLGSITVAAHQVASNFSSLIFMIPMSIGAALSIRVGHLLGRKDIEEAKIASHCGLLVGLLTAMLTAVLTVVFREQIAQMYTDNPEVIFIAGQLLFLAAVYQCTDAIQVVAAGALRGYKDMRAIFIRTFIAYWILGLPIGYILGITDWLGEPMGPHGFWIGNIIGLTAAAIMLATRLRWIHRQDDESQIAMSLR